MKHLTLFVSLICSALLTAQVSTRPTIIPIGYTGEITVIFNPHQGNQGMEAATACYAHTGITYNGQSWQKVNTKWRDGLDKYKMTKNAEGNWELKITPNMFAYYGVPETTPITQLCFVFNDGPNGTLEGKAAGNQDIFIDLGEAPCEDIWTNFTPAAAITKARPSGIVNGIYYGQDGTSVTLCTYAASSTAAARHVFLLGDMTDWQLSNDYQLYRDGNYFWIELTGLTKGQEYRFQYAIERADGKHVQISDLFSEKLIHPDDRYEPRTLDPDLITYPRCGADGGYITVIQPGKPAYQWSDATLNFKRPNKDNLIIYELWVYDHTPKRSLEGLMERLDYLQNLGVNCIELMPVNEFDGNLNWGYSPNHYFALDKAYGSPEQLKSFVDACHQRGMAVILDMVFNHATDYNPMCKLYVSPADMPSNPWFNVSAPHGDVFYKDWNHGFAPAREHFTRALRYWLTEYKIDGYRMDLSHGLCSDQPNTSVENLKYYYTHGIKEVSPDAYFILEHWGNNMGSERPQLVNEGMMCWENTCVAFQQTAMGWLKDGDSFSQANRDGYVSYCENHDEERCFFKAKQWGNGTIASDEATRLSRVPLNIGFQCMLNGPQLFYHYAELGFDYSKFQNDKGAWGKDGKAEYGTSVSTSFADAEYKMNAKFRPENGGWFRSGARMQAYKKVAQAIQLRTRLLPSVFEGNPTAQNIGSGVSLRTIQWGSEVFVAGNFSATTLQTLNLPTGTWYDYFNQGTKASSSYSLAPGEFRIFTGRSIAAPTDIPDSYDFLTDLNGLFFSNEGKKDGQGTIKVLDHGQIIILREGVRYNILGARE